MDNINKEQFDADIKHYLNEVIPNQSPKNKERYFNKILYPYLTAIAYNATYSYNFDYHGTFLYDDVAQELVIFIFTKEDYILKHKDNRKFYNLYYTMMKRKFIDILRSKKAADNRVAKFLEIYNNAIAHLYSEARTAVPIISYDTSIEYNDKNN